MSSLLPPNSTPLEFALEAASAHAIDNIAVDLIRTLKDPRKIPAHLLPSLAWELSVDYWDEAWPEERQREVCARSLELHRKKGTLKAIRLMLSLAGVQAGITRSDTPYAFDVTLPTPQPEGLALTDGLYQKVHQMIDVARPARSPHTLRVHAKFSPAQMIQVGSLGTLTRANITQPDVHIKLQPAPVKTAASVGAVGTLTRASAKLIDIRIYSQASLAGLGSNTRGVWHIDTPGDAGMSLVLEMIPTASGQKRAMDWHKTGIQLDAAWVGVGKGFQAIRRDDAGRAITDTLKSPVAWLPILTAEEVSDYQHHMIVDFAGTSDTDYDLSEVVIADADRNAIAIYGHPTDALMTISPRVDHAFVAVDLLLSTMPPGSVQVVHQGVPLELYMTDQVATTMLAIATITNSLIADYEDRRAHERAEAAWREAHWGEIQAHQLLMASQLTQIQDNEILNHAQATLSIAKLANTVMGVKNVIS